MLTISGPTSYALTEDGQGLVMTFLDAPGPGHPDPAGFIATQRITVTFPILGGAVVEPLYPPAPVTPADPNPEVPA